MADKALLCGINDYRSISDLRGCLNDVANLQRLLVDTFGFDPTNVKTLADAKVTKAEVQKQMRWLLKDARKGDRLVFHFSGHGSFTADDPDADDEAGGVDELICLYDMDFDDDSTYFRDDELGAFAKELPRGAELVIVLDSCHSGSGTRMMLAPVPGKPREVREVLVDDQATNDRSAASGTGTRGASGLAAAGGGGGGGGGGGVADPQDNAVVRVRFVPPPAGLANRRPRGGGGHRRLAKSVAGLNHVLLAGCRDEQTSADAFIEGRPHGAFTFHLCRALQAGGREMDRRDLITKVTRALRDGRFTQVPQLEASSDRGPLFGGGGPTPPHADPVPPDPDRTPPTAGGGPAAAVDVLREIMSAGPLTADQRELLAAFRAAIGQPAAGGGGRVQTARDMTGRHLVYVHGICPHPPGFSDRWWDALRPHTTAFGDGRRDATRHEVVWSRHVNARDARAAGEGMFGTGGAGDGADPRAAELAGRLRGALEDRAVAAAVEAAPAVPDPDPDLPRGAFGEDGGGGGTDPRAFGMTEPFGDQAEDPSGDRGLSIPGLGCVDDFVKYSLNDAVRRAVLAEFTQTVGPLLAAGAEVDVIAHSWGTVVAYEGLRELDAAGPTPGRVRTLFTVGAALAMAPVRGQLRRENRDGRKPAGVRRWVNIDAANDPVGGRLRGVFAVDAEQLDLPNMGCKRWQFSCAHSSYFLAANLLVNRDVFAAFINGA